MRPEPAQDHPVAPTSPPTPVSESLTPATTLNSQPAGAKARKSVRRTRSRSPRIGQRIEFTGFLKLMRTPTTMELVADRNALHLLTVIGLRARWSHGPSLDGLTFGQAKIGDHNTYGMTRKEESCARKRLRKYGLVSFDPSRLGTVATLLDSRVFSLVDERQTPKQGHRKGQPIPEGNPTFGDIDADNEGASRGHQGDTNQKGRRAESSENNTERGSAKPEQARGRDLFFDALAEATGSRPSELVGSPAKKCGVALASIRKATPDVTPEEIHRRAQNYATHFDAPLTPFALSSHWAKCHAAKGGSSRQLSPQFNKF